MLTQKQSVKHWNQRRWCYLFLQASKGKKKKGGAASAKLNSGRDNNYDDYTVGGYDDFDDFI